MVSRLLSPFFVFGMLAIPCLAQTQDSGSGSSNTTTPATPGANAEANTSTGTKKPKKVWTNDEIGSVKGGVSVVGDPDPLAGKKGSAKPATAANANQVRQMQIRNYREQILQLQVKIDAIDKRMAQLKDFKGENTSPSGGLQLYHNYNMVPIEEQVKQLEEKKKQLQSKIGDVENEARKNAIDAGELR